MVESASSGLLGAFKVLDHGAPEETHELAVGLMNRHRMRLGSNASGFQADIRATPAGGVSMLYFSYGVATEYEELVLSMLLLDHEHSSSDSVHSQIPALPGKAMRAAVRYIEEHYMQPLTAALLAEASYVGERTLYEGFQREFGITPMAYVRRFRLERAREALIAATPDDGATVAEISLSHGFGHLGRFAASYRERYGESPSETLRR